MDKNIMNNNPWWGYKHISGTYQVKRYFDKLDIIEVQESPFVDICYGPFGANSREQALKIIMDKL